MNYLRTSWSLVVSFSYEELFPGLRTACCDCGGFGPQDVSLCNGLAVVDAMATCLERASLEPRSTGPARPGQRSKHQGTRRSTRRDGTNAVVNGFGTIKVGAVR